MKTDKPARGFLWNTSLYLVSTVFSVAVNLLILPIYTRHLSPSDYGVVVLFVMFGTLSANILSANLHFASYMYYFQFKKDIERFRIIYSTNALFLSLVFLVSGVAVYLLSDWISLALFKGRLVAGLVFLSFLSGCLEYFVSYMITLVTAQAKSMQYATVMIVRVCVNTLFAFYLIFAKSLTYLALIYSLISAQVVAIVVLCFLIRDLFSLSFSLSDLKMSLKLSSPLVPNSMVGMIYSSFDKTMLNKLKDTGSVSYYSFGEKFSLILKSVQDAVSKSWEPFFMNKAHEDSVSAREAIITRFYELAFLFMAIGLCVIYYSEEMIKILTTKAFYPSMYVVPLYVYFYLFGILGILSMNQIGFSKKMKYLLPTSICTVISNVVLNIVLIPRFGAIGAAGAIAISALLSNTLNLFSGMKLYPLPLGKWRLVKMYLILIVFTVPAYPIMYMDLGPIAKVAVKFVLILSFVLIGIKLSYVSKVNLMRISDKVKGAVFNLAKV